jgi:hypothetical protein
MPSGADQPARPLGTESAADIRALFVRCNRKQEEMKPAGLEAGRKFMIRQASLRHIPLFSSTESTTPTAVLILQGRRYEELVQRLRAARCDDFWGCLAKWFLVEGIHDPEEFVPAEVWKRLTGEAEARAKGFFQADYYNAILIRLWLPYLEPLLRKAKWLRSTGVRALTSTLAGMGYDSEAISLVLSKKVPWRSAVELTCEWLAHKTPAYKGAITPTGESWPIRVNAL